MPLNYTNKNHSEQKRFSHFRSFFWVFRAEHRSSIGIFQALFFRLFEVETRKMVSAVVPLWRQLISNTKKDTQLLTVIFLLCCPYLCFHTTHKNLMLVCLLEPLQPAHCFLYLVHAVQYTLRWVPPLSICLSICLSNCLSNSLKQIYTFA